MFTTNPAPAGGDLPDWKDGPAHLLATLVKAPATSDTGSNGQVLIIMNDRDLGLLLFYCLTAAGFRARVIERDADGAREVERELPDVVVLDSKLPDRRSTDVWRQIRSVRRGAQAPAVIMLIGGEQDIDPRLGLEFGPCDFVVYPISVRDLVLRIDNIVRLRRSLSTDGPPRVPRGVRYQVGPVELDLGRQTVELNGVPLPITPLELRVLAYLIQHRERVCTREDLLTEVWGYRSGIQSRVTDIHINRLRIKLGAAASLIETLRGTGYRLSADFPVIAKD